MKNNIFKYQGGGMSPVDLDPRMLSDMMAQQGAGQGVDYNGQPTPNVSGEPSFADMAQEIQDRYDTLIFPLQRKLDKLQKRLENNPSDQTIKNEIKRIEEQIDTLEQREDMELQKLEAEVQRAGNEIEQQKQMEGYGDVEMPQESQGMPDMGSEEMEIPMMQEGGKFEDNFRKLSEKQMAELYGYPVTFSDNTRTNVGIAALQQEKAKQAQQQLLQENNPKYAVITASSKPAETAYSQSEKMNTVANRFYANPQNLFITNPNIPVTYKDYMSGSLLTSQQREQGKRDADVIKHLFGTAVFPEFIPFDLAMNADKIIPNSEISKAVSDFGTLASFMPFGFTRANPLVAADKIANSTRTKAITAIEPAGTMNKRVLNGGEHAQNRILDRAYRRITDKTQLNNEERNKLLEKALSRKWNTLKNIGKKLGDVTLRGITFPFALAGRPAVKTASLFGNTIYPTMKGYFSNLGSYKLPEATFKQPKNWLSGLGALGASVGAYGIPGLGMYFGSKLTEKDKQELEKAENENYIENYKNNEELMDQNYYGADEEGIARRQTGWKTNKYNVGDEVAVIGDDKKEEEATRRWVENYLSAYLKENPTGIRGYFKDTPATEYITWGNALGKLFDTSGKTNIDAQNQYRYNTNPYTSVYDRANREYHEQLANTGRRYDIIQNELRRLQPQTEYGSMQQAFNARLAQDMLNRQQQSKIENDRQAAIDSVQNSFGKAANDAYTSMMEQSYKNNLMNEAQRKAYLQALDVYNKEKQAQFDQVVNMAAIAGNRRKDIDILNTFLLPQILNAASTGASMKDVLAFTSMYPLFQQKQSNS